MGDMANTFLALLPDEDTKHIYKPASAIYGLGAWKVVGPTP